MQTRNPQHRCVYDVSHYSMCNHELQKVSLQSAGARNRHWTSSELDFVVDTLNEPLYEVAEALGRTYYSVANQRLKIKRRLRP